MNNIGATGRFPDGKVTPDDEGELAIAITHKDGLVNIYFGKEVSWIGMRPQDARGLAALLVQHADGIEKEQG